MIHVSKLKSTSRATAFALALLPFATAAVEPIHFEVRNNADLVAVCSTRPEDPNYIAAIHFCHGVGVGLVRYQEALQEGKDFDPIFCLPKSLTRTQAVEAYVLPVDSPASTHGARPDPAGRHAIYHGAGKFYPSHYDL
ncbi:MAG: hypothetical protein ACU841_16795 [Gammaproteobacteria bacterium]